MPKVPVIKGQMARAMYESMQSLYGINLAALR